MKKILVLISVGLLLAGCGGKSIFGIANPVGDNALGAAISSYGILDTAVIAYRGLPRCTVSNNFSATNICHKRSVLVSAQAYDAAANKAINTAVAYQRANPTLDASSYITAAEAAVSTFKSFAVAANLPGVN
jgi:hypothetical protein